MEILKAIGKTLQHFLKQKISCLFCWDEVPGNDTGRLMGFLIQNFNVNWVITAKIEKNDDGRAIKISEGTNHLSLKLNKEKTKVTLTINDDKTAEFDAKTENNKLNIYDLSDNSIRLEDNSIFFNSPADIDTTKIPKHSLSIFLYQIVENNYLRNIEPETLKDRMIQPPLVLDLYYIFTPYAKDDPETELRILEKIMQTFHDNSVLKGEILEKGLEESGNDEIRVVPNNLTFDEINKLWERFPNKPFKLSASYILTPVKIPSEKEPVGIKRVIERDIKLYRLVQKSDQQEKNLS